MLGVRRIALARSPALGRTRLSAGLRLRSGDRGSADDRDRAREGVATAVHEVEEDLLQARSALQQRGEREPRGGGDGADRRSVGVVHGQARPEHVEGQPGVLQGGGEGCAVVGVDDDRSGGRIRELADAVRIDQAALGEHEHVVGDLLDLAQHVRRDQHSAALVGEAAHEQAHPADALGVEAVRGLVEHERSGVAEQGAGDAEALPHAERVGADARLGLVLQAHEGEHLVHAGERDPVRLRGDRQLARGRAAGPVDGLLEHGSDGAQRVAQLGVRDAADGRGARGRADLAEHHPQRRRLAGAVRPEERGHRPRLDTGGEVVDSGENAEALRRMRELEHLSVGHPRPLIDTAVPLYLVG